MSSYTQAIAVQVPAERMFEFHRLMNEHGFTSFFLWAYSDWPDKYKVSIEAGWPGPTRERK